MASIHFDAVSKVFDEETVALEELTLEIADGELVVLVGPSGSGKSTALRILAGLEEETSGTVRIGDQVVNGLEPKDRDIAMVFQSYALYPHMSVSDNLGFGLRMRGEPKETIGERVGDTAGRLGISGLLERRPRQLSGGQRQRVALGRAIVRAPQAFLMDEPLSNLDAQLRVEMRAYISRLHGELGTTTVFVTHDQVEAMTMGDRVAVMRDGRLEQVDVPQALYDRPANAFVAGFIGSPSMNLLRARLARNGSGVVAQLGSSVVRVPEPAFERYPGALAYLDDEIVVGIRPEALRPDPDAGAESIGGDVLLVESLGSDVLVHLELDAPAVLAGEALEVARELGPTNGQPEQSPIRADRARFTARLPVAEAPQAGQALQLGLDPERLHFFAPNDGRALR